MLYLSLGTLLLVALVSPQEEADPPGHLFLDNGTIRLGVDLESGGSVFHFSRGPKQRNLLNHHDRGRFIQQSWYGVPDGTHWNDKKWCWNPVQGGDWRGNPGKLLEQKKTETTLYTRSTPRHWSGCVDVPEAKMEQWITLEGELAHVRYRFTYNGEVEHPKKHQEMPAVFVDHALPNLVFHAAGDDEKPWSDGKLTRIVPGWPNKGHWRGECWAAYVDDEDHGIGVFTPGTPEMTCYRYAGRPGPKGGGCSYFAPVRTLAITPGAVFEYDIHLTIGSVEEIRGRFAEVHRRREAAEASSGSSETEEGTDRIAPSS